MQKSICQCPNILAGMFVIHISFHNLVWHSQTKPIGSCIFQNFLPEINDQKDWS